MTWSENFTGRGNQNNRGDGMAEKSKMSKRYMLSKLPDGWRESIFLSLHSERLKLAVAVLSASGCRPSELEVGVLVSHQAGKLKIGIQGSKVDEVRGRGQPLRLLSVDDSTLWGAYLAEQISLNEGKPILVKYDAGGISQRLREKTREIWPRRSKLISAYTYRHYIGKSMKESGEAKDNIAAVLGHASDFSQSVYGRAGRSKKGAGQHGIKRAIASNPIRHSPKTDKLKMLISRQSAPAAD